jgi:hypothetical protein
VSEVSHQTEVVSSLRKSIEQKSLPHLIFYGPPGTGKTSTILACARDLFGADYRSRVMELNASDERGIAVVRNKIKAFAQLAVGSKTENTGPNAPPPYKLIGAPARLRSSLCARAHRSSHDLRLHPRASTRTHACALEEATTPIRGHEAHEAGAARICVAALAALATEGRARITPRDTPQQRRCTRHVVARRNRCTP